MWDSCSQCSSLLMASAVDCLFTRGAVVLVWYMYMNSFLSQVAIKAETHISQSCFTYIVLWNVSCILLETRVKDGGGEAKYRRSMFSLNCTGKLPSWCSMSWLHYMWKPNSELLENLCQVMLFRAMLSYSSKRCITRKFNHLAIGDLLQHALWDLLIATLWALWVYALNLSAEAWILITSQALCLSAGKFLPTICIHLMIVQISLDFCSEGYVGHVMLRY